MRQRVKRSNVETAVSVLCDRSESLRTAMALEDLFKNLHRVPVEEIEKLTAKYGE